VGDEIAHIAWLLPPSAAAMEVPQILQLGEDEAEITCCETPPGWRGKGMYPFAIRQIAAVARSAGIRRLYMKTSETNTASQRGIIKAGFLPIGSISVAHPPLRPSVTVVKRNLTWPETRK
jgi:hypothetical protein